MLATTNLNKAREIREIFAALNDPKAIEEIVARIRDDEFESTDAAASPAGDADSGDGDDESEALEPQRA